MNNPTTPTKREEALKFVDYIEEHTKYLSSIPPVMFEKIRAALTQPQEPGDLWQDISTAPRDGRIFLAYTEEQVKMNGKYLNCVPCYFDPWRGSGLMPLGELGFVVPIVDGTSSCYSLRKITPTHWQKLPPAPTSEKDGV